MRKWFWGLATVTWGCRWDSLSIRQCGDETSGSVFDVSSDLAVSKDKATDIPGTLEGAGTGTLAL